MPFDSIQVKRLVPETYVFVKSLYMEMFISPSRTTLLLKLLSNILNTECSLSGKVEEARDVVRASWRKHSDFRGQGFNHTPVEIDLVLF